MHPTHYTAPSQTLIDDDEESDQAYQACFVTKIVTPNTYRDACSGTDAGKWQAAMEKELSSLASHNTGDLVPLPTGRKAVACKWVYRVKLTPQGEPSSYKARLVAKGFTQRKGLDYFDTYAPVTRLNSIRLLLTIASSEKLEVDTLDVDSAYLHGVIDTDIYMRQPEGFVNPEHPKWVLKLNKTLYGLKQAGKIWNDVVDSTLLELGFVPTHGDPCLYVYNGIHGKVYLGVYVDDFLIAAKRTSLNWFEQEMSKRFQCKICSPVSQILGVTITPDGSGGFYLSQENYITTTVEEFGLQNASPLSLPVAGGDLGATFSDNSPLLSNQSLYRQIVGKVMYAMLATRPDIAYAVGFLGRHSHAPTELHLGIAKRLLRYLKGTATAKLQINAVGKPLILTSYSDADWAGSEERKSTYGYVNFVAGAPINWASKLESCVALSTMEAEYIAACQTTRDIVSHRSILSDLGHPQVDPTIIYEDNQSTMYFAKGQTSHQRTKHIDIQWHYLRQEINEGAIEMEYIPSSEQIADMFTKPLSAYDLRRLSSYLLQF